MPWIDRPAISSNGAIISSGFHALYVATEARPADRLQVIQIKEQFEITLVWFKVVYDRAAWVIPARLQMRIAAAVLASVFVSCQCLSSRIVAQCFEL